MALYIDSEAGSDANSGTSPAAPFQTLAAGLAAFTSGAVYLARGSTFREELMGWPVGAKIRTYGAGDRPVIDGRDEAADFNPAPDRVDVWQVAWTHGFAVDGGKSKHRAWEDGVMMVRAADLDDCEATPGSFWADDPTSGGPDLVYIHPSGGVPADHEYLLSRRRYCVNLYAEYNQADVIGLETIGNAYADGSLLIDGYAEDCVARDGRYHNAFILGTAVNCQAFGIEPGFGTMFISYYDSTGSFGGPAERDVVYRGCIADAQGGDSLGLISAYYTHTNNDGRIFGTVQYEDCYAADCRDGWGGSAARVFLCYRCSYEDITFAYSFHPTEDVVLLGGEGELSAVVNGKLLSTTAPVRILAHGLKCLAPGGGQGPILVNHAAAEVSIDRCTVVASNGGSIIYQRGDVTLRRSVFAGNNLVAAFLGSAGAQLDAYDADECCYWASNIGNGAFGRAFGGTTFYTTLASWRAYLSGAGFATDAASLAQDPQVAADFTIGNPTVAAVAGAALDEEADPVLQRIWRQYRVTPPRLSSSLGVNIGTHL